MTRAAEADIAADVDRVLIDLRDRRDAKDAYRKLEALAGTNGKDSTALPGGVRGRFHLARGIALNRLGLADDALADLDTARRLFDADAHHADSATTSIEIARVYSWRGDGAGAAFALLDASRASVDIRSRPNGRIFLEAGRLHHESGRFDRARAFIVAALEADGDSLSQAERNSAAVMLAQASLAQGDFEAASQVLEKVDVTTASVRVRHLVAIEKARCALRKGGGTVDVPSSADCDPDSFEAIELQELMAEVAAAQGRTGDALVFIRAVVARFAEDDLAGREADARIQEAKIFADMGDAQAASRTLVVALRRARARALAGHVERIAASLQDLDLSVDNIDFDPDPGAPLQRRRFVRRRPIGAGGSGSVQRAYDLETGLDVALKTVDLAAEYDPEERHRCLVALRQETENTRRLRHPGIARVFGLSEDNGRIELVREFIEGQTLRTAMATPIAISVRYAIFAELGYALSSLHATGIVHRDLKPENVVLRPDGHPVLIDLGSSALSGAQSGTGLSADYAAPEQFRGDRVDARADVFAFATVVSEWMLGRRPPRLQEGLLAWSRRRALMRILVDELRQSGLSATTASLLVKALSPSTRARPLLAALIDALLSEAMRTGYDPGAFSGSAPAPPP